MDKSFIFSYKCLFVGLLIFVKNQALNIAVVSPVVSNQNCQPTSLPNQLSEFSDSDPKFTKINNPTNKHLYENMNDLSKNNFNSSSNQVYLKNNNESYVNTKSIQYLG